MSVGAAVLLFVIGAALMLKASRVGTAFILLVLMLLAIAGMKGFFLYILLPVVGLFISWVIYLYFKEKKRIAIDEAIGRQFREQTEQSSDANT